jgi:hypothetical protein
MLWVVFPFDQFRVHSGQTFVAVSITVSPGQSPVLPVASTTGADGNVSVTMETGLEAALSPHRLVLVAVYKPSVDTVIMGPVSPFDQFTIQSGHKSEATS